MNYFAKNEGISRPDTLTANQSLRQTTPNQSLQSSLSTTISKATLLVKATKKLHAQQQPTFAGTTYIRCGTKNSCVSLVDRIRVRTIFYDLHDSKLHNVQKRCVVVPRHHHGSVFFSYSVFEQLNRVCLPFIDQICSKNVSHLPF